MSSQKGIIMSDWGKRLQEVRLQHEITQNELAQKIGIDTTALSRYERGRGAKQMPSNVKDKLIGIFSVEEITYIDIGKSASQSIVGHYNTVAGRDNHIGDSAETMDAYTAAVVQAMSDLDDDEKLGVLSCIKDIKENRTKK